MEKAPLFSEIAECPVDGSAFWLHAEDGARVRIGVWKSVSLHKGTIFIFPGRTEYVEKYGRTVADLHHAGFSVVVIDWRGQGLADRQLEDRMIGHVDDFSSYQQDVRALLEAATEIQLPQPWNLVGHSLGACIGLRAIINGFPISHCAFTGPMWGINLPPIKRAAALPVSWLAEKIGMGGDYALGANGTSYVLRTEFEENGLTNDADMYKYYIRQAETLTEHQLGGPSWGWLHRTLKETSRLSKAPSPNVECITFCGLDDFVIDISAVKRRMQLWPNGKLQLVPDAKHDLFCEVSEIRASVTETICDFFSANTNGSDTSKEQVA